MGKKFLVATFVLLLAVTAGIAAQSAPQNGTLPFYWISGRVTDKDSEAPVEGQKVIAYTSDTGNRIETLTEADGLYKLNIYELYYYNNIPIAFDGTKYNVAVPRYPQFTKGDGPASLALDVNVGFITQNFAVYEGGGPIIDVVTTGTIPLSIRRSNDGSSVVIEWDKDRYADPQIFMLSGDGTGQFVKDGVPPWVAVTDPSVSDGFDNVTRDGLSDGLLVHTGQIGGGFKEVYYKGLQKDIKPADINPDTGTTNLAAAGAVGKVNVGLAKTVNSGWNFVSSPLIINDFDKQFGVNFSNGDQIWSWYDLEQRFFAPVTFDGKTWGKANFVPGNGYLFNLSGGNKTVSLIGKVNIAALTRNISIKADTPTYGWNMVGNPQATLSPMTGLSAGKSVATDSLWDWNSQEQKFFAPLIFDGANWPAKSQLKITVGYGYNHTGNGFIWQMPAQ